LQFLEYALTLNTGEELSFCELNSDLVPELAIPEVLQASSSILSLCTHVDRDTIEKAKREDMKPLERALRTPPYGCLMKVDKPICLDIKNCIRADKKVCTTRNTLKQIGQFPVCWTYPIETRSRELCTAIIHAWKEGKYVIIVTK
jgi:hypothetical protein